MTHLNLSLVRETHHLWMPFSHAEPLSFVYSISVPLFAFSFVLYLPRYVPLPDLPLTAACMHGEETIDTLLRVLFRLSPCGDRTEVRSALYTRVGSYSFPHKVLIASSKISVCTSLKHQLEPRLAGSRKRYRAMGWHIPIGTFLDTTDIVAQAVTNYSWPGLVRPGLATGLVGSHQQFTSPCVYTWGT